jgi:DNA-binding response OmpR family regulator
MQRPSADVMLKIQIGSLEIDVAHRIVRKGGNVVSLTVNEWALLLTLLDAESSVSAEKLLSSVFEEDMLEHPSLVTHWINRLRQHLEDDPNRPHYILGDTVNGFALRRD